MGNCHQLPGSPRWVLLPNLAPDCKTPVGAGTADAEEVSEGMQSSCLLPDSMDYQFTRDEAYGCCLVSGHIRTRSVFSCPTAV